MTSLLRKMNHLERFLEMDALSPGMVPFSFDPLRMISSETLAATIPEESVGGTVYALNETGVPFADLGHIVQGKGFTLLKNGRRAKYYEIRCQDDGMARIWALYPRIN
jgi:hydrogenase maturation factor